MRLFAALDLSGEHRRLLSSLRRPIPGVTWYPPETYHLTLRFIGDITSRPLLEEIDHALASVEGAAFAIEPSGVGISTPPARARLWAGVRPSDALARLQSRIETALRRAGLPAEKKRFQPHIALAALGGAPDAETIQWMQGHNLMRGTPATIGHFTLFRSHRSHDAPVYESCAEYPFSGGISAPAGMSVMPGEPGGFAF